MSLLVLSALEQSVPPQVRNRGEEYARDGSVQLLRRLSAADPLSAIVTGSDEYLVTLRYEARTLWGACTCPYYDDHVDVCKHIWATLIECAAKKIAFPGPVDDLLIDDQAADFEDDDDFYVEPSRWRSQLGSLTHYGFSFRLRKRGSGLMTGSSAHGPLESVSVSRTS